MNFQEEQRQICFNRDRRAKNLSKFVVSSESLWRSMILEMTFLLSFQREVGPSLDETGLDEEGVGGCDLKEDEASAQYDGALEKEGREFMLHNVKIVDEKVCEVFGRGNGWWRRREKNEVEKMKVVRFTCSLRVQISWWSADTVVGGTACQQMEYIHNPSSVEYVSVNNFALQAVWYLICL